MTKCDAFRGTAAQVLSNSQTDRLYHGLRWAGSMEIIFSRNNALLATSRIKFLQRTAYINLSIYPFASIFLYSSLSYPSLRLSGLGVGLEEWWTNEQFWIIDGTSAHLVDLLQGLLKVITSIEIKPRSTSEPASENEDDAYTNLYRMTRSWLLVIPLLIIALNIGTNNWDSNIQLDTAWSKLLRGAFFTFWVLAHMYPFAKGLKGEEEFPPLYSYGYGFFQLRFL
ncbi:UNVERIFIED_CONTAM: Cellulose synthase-like protein D1 [Sesamum calycinum]|uniref:Cellulose synthase-like protein D1 n=1 Tax=Sesamum calycinum TaxID=2727403 RepID=A0AAW2QML6_9LAMI